MVQVNLIAWTDRTTRGARWVGLSAALGLLGCEKAGPPPSAPSPESKSRVESEEVAPKAAPPRPQVQPVSAPEGRILRMRLERPGVLMDRALGGAGVPLRFRDLYEPGDRFLGLPAKVLDLDGAFEGVISLNPDPENESPLGVVSAAVLSLDAALSALHERHVSVMEGPDGAFYYQEADLSCMLGAAIGAKPWRVACGMDSPSVSALGPYALRGLPAETWSSAPVAMELNLLPVRETFGSRARNLKLLASLAARELHVGHPRFDHALSSSAIALADEASDLLSDVDGLALEVQQSERGDFTAVWTAEFSSISSWTGRVLAEAAAEAKGPEERLARLPQNVTSGSFLWLPSRSKTKKMEHLLTELVAGSLEHHGASPGLVKDVELVAKLLFATTGATHAASGPLPEAKSPGAPVQPWSASWLPQRPEEVVSLVDRLAKLGRSKEWAKVAPELEDALDLKPARGQQLGGAKVYEYHWSSDLSEAAQSASESLGPMVGQRLALAGFVAILPAGDGGTRVLTAPTLDLLREADGALRESESTSVHQDGQFLGRQRSVFSGFLRVSSIAAAMTPYLSPENGSKLAELLHQTPNGGEIPLRFWLNAEQGAKWRLRFTTEVPSAFVSDITALAVLFATEPPPAAIREPRP